MVEEEVDHLAAGGEDGEEAHGRSGARGSAEGVEARERSAEPEGFSGQTRGGLAALGVARGSAQPPGIEPPVEELRDVLEGLHELVDPVALRQEDYQLVHRVVHAWLGLRSQQKVKREPQSYDMSMRLYHRER